jgi:DNA-binding FadR family transcriptional regulator
MFQKTKHNRMYENVVEQVKNAILDGKLKPGDKLPTEKELKDLFDVSRGTLREALRVLEQRGLITIKTGANGGVFVKSPTAQEASRSLDLLFQYQGSG